MARVANEVASLFNEVQRSAAATERCVKHIWRLAQQWPDEATAALARFVELVLAAGQKCPPVERCVRFLSAFASRMPPSEIGEAFLEALMHKLHSHLDAADKAVRFRAAQALAAVLQSLPEGGCIDEALAQQLAEGLRDRLRDKSADVRQCAARAMGRLPAADEDGSYADDFATCALLERLEVEKHKDVRAAVLQALPLDNDTLPVILTRLRDVAPCVRKAVVMRLGGLPPSVLSIKQRVQLISSGLRDRDAQVKAAAESGLARWLGEHCSGNVLALLELLDVETYADEATLALECLLSTGALNAAELAQKAAASSRGLRGAAESAAAGGAGGEGVPAAALIQPAEALMWRCVCDWLQRSATSEGLAAASTTGASAAMRAAAASQRHEVLDRILPETAAGMVALLLAHATAGPRHRFAATQLAVIAATCLDWADAAGRRAAADALRMMMAQDPRGEADQDPDDDDDNENSSGGSGVPLFGNGGDGKYEKALARLAASVHAGGPQEYGRAMLDALGSLAARAGLMRKPGAADKDDDGSGYGGCGGDGGSGEADGDGEGGGVAEPCQWLQLLQYAALLLRALPTKRVVGAGRARGWDVEGAAMTLRGVREALLLLGVRHPVAAVRSKALECLTLHCQASPSPDALPATALLLRRALISSEAPEVKASAVRGMTDLFLSLGPVALESVLAAAGAAGQSEVGGAAGSLDTATRQQITGEEGELEGGGRGGSDEGEAHGWRSGAGRGAVQLITVAVQDALVGVERAAAGTAKVSTSGGRSSGASSTPVPQLSDAEADLLSTGSEALAKLLLHQRAWRRAAAAADADAGATDPSCLCPSASAGVLRRALSLLLLLNFHPATEQALRLRQCLSVFFEIFARSSADLRSQLAGAALPAARAVHAFGGAGRVAAARQPAPMVLRFVLQLLSQGEGGKKEDGEEREGQEQAQAQKREGKVDGGDWGVVVFCQQLLTEAEHVWKLLLSRGVQPARNRPYAVALIEVVQGLPIPAGCGGLGVLLVIAQRLADQCCADAALSKHASALLQHLGRLEAEGAAAPDEDELEEVIGRLRGMCLEMQPGLAGVEGEKGGAAMKTPATARRGGGGARGGAASVGKRGRGAGKSGAGGRADEEWGEGGGGIGSGAGGVDAVSTGRRMPQRTARSKGRSLVGVLLTSSSSDESEGEGEESKVAASGKSKAGRQPKAGGKAKGDEGPRGREGGDAASAEGSDQRVGSASGAAGGSRKSSLGRGARRVVVTDAEVQGARRSSTASDVSEMRAGQQCAAQQRQSAVEVPEDAASEDSEEEEGWHSAGGEDDGSDDDIELPFRSPAGAVPTADAPAAAAPAQAKQPLGVTSSHNSPREVSGAAGRLGGGYSGGLEGGQGAEGARKGSLLGGRARRVTVVTGPGYEDDDME